MNPIHYSDGSIVVDPVVQIWDDLHAEQSGRKRAFWCASPEATTGSPVVGYCSSGGSHKSVRAAADEVRHRYPHARIYNNGRQLKARVAMSNPLPKIHAGSPLHTNADLNRLPCHQVFSGGHDR